MRENVYTIKGICYRKRKPRTHRKCHVRRCRSEWFTTTWSSCSEGCGAPGLRTREAVCLVPAADQLSYELSAVTAVREGGLVPAADQLSCDSGPEPERSQECRVEKCEAGVVDTDVEEEEEEYEEEYEEDFEPEELALQTSTRARPVIIRNSILSNEIPEIVPEKYRARKMCEDKFKNCVVVVGARLCVYSFYQSNCCRSCRDVTSSSVLP